MSTVVDISVVRVTTTDIFSTLDLKVHVNLPTAQTSETQKTRYAAPMWIYCWADIVDIDATFLGWRGEVHTCTDDALLCK